MESNQVSLLRSIVFVTITDICAVPEQAKSDTATIPTPIPTPVKEPRKVDPRALAWQGANLNKSGGFGTQEEAFVDFIKNSSAPVPTGTKKDTPTTKVPVHTAENAAQPTKIPAEIARTRSPLDAGTKDFQAMLMKKFNQMESAKGGSKSNKKEVEAVPASAIKAPTPAVQTAVLAMGGIKSEVAFATNKKQHPTQSIVADANPWKTNSKELSQDVVLSAGDALDGFSSIYDKAENRVSNDGVEHIPENVRANQGKSAEEELVDWNGRWLPAPIWEERGAHDNSYVSAFISEWLENKVMRYIYKAVDTSAKAFYNQGDAGKGLAPESGRAIDTVEGSFLEFIEQPEVKTSKFTCVLS